MQFKYSDFLYHPPPCASPFHKIIPEPPNAVLMESKTLTIVHHGIRNKAFNGVYTSGQMDFYHGGLDNFFPSMKHRGGVLIH